MGRQGSSEWGITGRLSAWVPCQPWMPHLLVPPQRRTRRSTSRPHPRRAGAVRTAARRPRGTGRAAGTASTAVSQDPEGPRSAGPPPRSSSGAQYWPSPSVWCCGSGPGRTCGSTRRSPSTSPGSPCTSSPRTCDATAPHRCSMSLLHFWMGMFGTSDVAVRSLSGLFGVVTVPLAWLAGQRLGGTTAAWAAMLLVATSPFAVRYDTETRMYSLVVLLTVLGFLALDRALRQPRPGNLVAVAAVTGLLLYSHYWSIYLLGTTMLWLLYQAWRGRPEWRRGARAALAAVGGRAASRSSRGSRPSSSSRSTPGRPWATPATFAAMVSAVASFAGGSTSQGRALALLFFALGRARPLRPGHRPAATSTSTSGPVPPRPSAGHRGARHAGRRHRGRTGHEQRIRRPLRVGGLHPADPARGARGHGVPRPPRPGGRGGHRRGPRASPPRSPTSSPTGPRPARSRQPSPPRAKPGDVVAYCPDQLGPAVDRLLPGGRYTQTTFPRGTGPRFVNWVDYATAVGAASPLGFAQHLEALAAGGHQIYMVWAPGYQAFGVKCEGIVQTLQADPVLQPLPGRGRELPELLPAHVPGAVHADRGLTAVPDGVRGLIGRAGSPPGRRWSRGIRRSVRRGPGAGRSSSDGPCCRSCRRGSWPGWW